MDVEQFSLIDLFQGDIWNHDNLNRLFGSNVDLNDLRIGSIDCNPIKHWTWAPKTSKTKLAAAVYHQLNMGSIPPDC